VTITIEDLIAELHPDWHKRAACRGLNPELFFPQRGQNHAQIAKCRAICAGCTERGPCLEQALADHDILGIFGGTVPNDRRAILRKRAAT
jgi:WhiB family redox-sensing transcriptional regulator